jgi:lysophospholipase L1-like esterase
MRKKYSLLALCFLLISWNTQKKEIFLIGDSISIEYWIYLKEYIADYALLERKQDDGEAIKNLDIPMGANGGDSRMVLLYLKSKLKEPLFKPHYMLINCGLHDIKRNTQASSIQIEKEEYKENITEIFQLLNKENISSIWINTTWVIDSIHNTQSKAFFRYNTDVIEYNEIAADVCSKYGIPIIDLYTFSKKLGQEQIRDHVHYTSSAQTLQAAYIAGFIQKYIK